MELPLSQYKKPIIYTTVCVVLIVFFVRAFHQFVAPPADFPLPYHLTIERGQTLFSLSRELATAHVISSPRLFEVFIITLGSEKNLSEGEYYFDRPLNAFEIALRISGRQFGITKQKITFPEGFTNKQMALRLAQTFDSFDEGLFLTLAHEYEGYLFPDTYHFFPGVTPDVVVTALRQTFDNKTKSIATELEHGPRTKKDLIIMASIIEKEAAGDDDRAMISGILWKRLDQGLPLQVDAPFLYILGKESKELTKADLAINSPYNTYRYKGLPPTPIGNPGLASIEAALSPKDSPYLYYLHDARGSIHYARTYQEHLKNIKTHLR